MAFDQEIVDAWKLYKSIKRPTVCSYSWNVGNCQELHQAKAMICQGDDCKMSGVFIALKSDRYPVVWMCPHCGALHQANGRYIPANKRWVKPRGIARAIVNAPFRAGPIAQLADLDDQALDDLILPFIDYEARLNQLGLQIN